MQRRKERALVIATSFVFFDASIFDETIIAGDFDLKKKQPHTGVLDEVEKSESNLIPSSIEDQSSLKVKKAKITYTLEDKSLSIISDYLGG